MKVKSLVICFFILALFSCNGGRRFYKILNSNPQKPQLQNYKNLHISWLPIKEEDWKTWEYNSKDEWLHIINNINITQLQQFVNDYLPNKNITGAKFKEDKLIPPQTDLIIRFISFEISEFGNVGLLDVEFFDTKVKQIVYKTSSEIYSKDTWGGFESNLTNLMYYIGNFLDYQFR
jgi:hypothetical protein